MVAAAVLAAVVGWACVVARVLAGGVSRAELHVVGATMAVGVGLASFAASVVVQVDRMAHGLTCADGQL